nr:helix-turn-helix domain-containing protein [uncultured Macellibacteroides sp.]
MEVKSQTQLIHEHLENGGTLTPLEALNLFGCFRLSGRIHDLRSSGIDVKTEIVQIGGKNVAKYSLEKHC